MLKDMNKNNKISYNLGFTNLLILTNTFVDKRFKNDDVDISFCYILYIYYQTLTAISSNIKIINNKILRNGLFL